MVKIAQDHHGVEMDPWALNHLLKGFMIGRYQIKKNALKSKAFIWTVDSFVVIIIAIRI